MMNFNEMSQAVKDARAAINVADSFTAEMARMIVGRLRNSGTSGLVLKALKKELSDYNMNTNSWKEKE